MESRQVGYRGYVIQPLLVFETEGRYSGDYEISRYDKLVRIRENIFPGLFYRSAALTNSIDPVRQNRWEEVSEEAKMSRVHGCLLT